MIKIMLIYDEMQTLYSEEIKKISYLPEFEIAFETITRTLNRPFTVVCLVACPMDESGASLFKHNRGDYKTIHALQTYLNVTSHLQRPKKSVFF